MRFLGMISQQLSRFTALVIVLAAAVTFIEPATFSWVTGDTQIIVLGIIMLAMGMTLGKEDYQILARRPLDIFIGSVIQYTIMPLLAIGVARLFDLSAGLTLGLVLVGTCPGGVSSNIMSYLAKGDVAFSVGMTTVSTIIAPLATPLWLNYLVGQSVEMDGWGMLRFMLLVTLLPVAIGSMLNILFHNKHWFKDVRAVMPGIAVLAFACIVGGVAAVFGDQFLQSGLVVILAIAVHNIAGYVLGYYSGAFFGMSTPKKRTISIEVGVQNAGLATGLSTKFFPGNAESAIAAAVACIWHSVSGSVLANVYARWDKHQQKKAAAVNDNVETIALNQPIKNS
ncbi:bile acid:sodium symporter family protein [Psychrobacter sp.]|uniref:bile acid:sodium symporter family protein n=1 Tax=Psychrobacter sp. TaxID=56811 RepID=UPI002647A9AE|nr:bile acid:sodium symporter family protein [Psychrobacter sp.]MDN6276012.1 bile acid:sodium symporter family protein [Psychrobacter sp.]MDN6308286.1 bile acid:sodium symporter family protein [Psychrobacter sp.]